VEDGMSTFVETEEMRLEREVQKGQEATYTLKKMYVARLREIEEERIAIGRKLSALGYSPDLGAYEGEP
jgi:hypothetical protein